MRGGWGWFCGGDVFLGLRGQADVVWLRHLLTI